MDDEAIVKFLMLFFINWGIPLILILVVKPMLLKKLKFFNKIENGQGLTQEQIAIKFISFN
ncbi:MAG: hypothetical protein OHM56_01490 [Spiroplasma phoeniceum]|nr:MAG: hypothetical protein OHM57_00925 [Spiroplasma phoeniceum]UZQ32662.1 MAG: hypothetical protein OHM56_01490 [Spiroplasma phoeniceum]